jgi:hypothetical protein
MAKLRSVVVRSRKRQRRAVDQPETQAETLKQYLEEQFQWVEDQFEWLEEELEGLERLIQSKGPGMETRADIGPSAVKASAQG